MISARPPLVTALIDTYNYAQFVEQAIESVLTQDYPKSRLQVLVVDDGSTDDTFERVKQYGDKIRYLRKENGGQGSAFNFGFSKAEGEIIAFLDADDYWLPGKLNRVVETFQTHPNVGLVFHRRKEFDSATKQFWAGEFTECSGYLPDNPRSLLAFRIPPTSAISFSRGVLARILPMPMGITLQADAYLALLAPLLAPVQSISEELCVYRHHGKNLYATRSEGRERLPEQLRMWHRILDAVKQWLGAQGLDLNRPEIQRFLSQWAGFIASMGFEVQPPSRGQLFFHLLHQHSLYWEQDGWKLRTMNVLNTMAAPVFGYANFCKFYEAELRVIANLQRVLFKKN